ncbi:MAG: hypothetical protein M1817_006786 [Caeruleum heppii]|nr:MAG: hypothetical protein M1817_006786 [Caeruleum heppii]
MESSFTTHRGSYAFIAPTRFADSLRGKVVVITGASRGIGRSCAEAFAAAGASLTCIARDRGALDEVVTSIQSRFGVSAIAIAIDVTDPSAPARVLEETRSKFGPIDILINNAGSPRFNTVEAETTLDDWWSVFALNFRAPVSFVHAVLPSMLARGQGTIISIGSTAGVQPTPFCTAYSTGKAALTKFHQELEAEISGRGVRNFIVHPGEVDTGAFKLPGAVNLETVQKMPRMAEHFQSLYGLETQQPQLAADTLVALCVLDKAKLLSGKFVDVRKDLEETIEACEAAIDT